MIKGSNANAVIHGQRDPVGAGLLAMNDNAVDLINRVA